MSKLSEINLNKNGMEKEKIESENQNSNKDHLLKAKSSIKENSNNLNNSNDEKLSKLLNTKKVIKSEQNKFNKFNSDFICDNFTLKKNPNIQRKINSEEERFKKIRKKLSERNNNINKRVKIFVPAKDYLDLLEDIDAEETEEIKKMINNFDINDNSEEEKLDNFIMNRIFSASNKFNSEIDNKNKNNNINSNFEIEDKYKNKIFDKQSPINFIKEKEYKNYIKNISNININQTYSKHIESKYLKIYEDNFTTFIGEIFFKHGKYEEDINKYNDCSLFIIKSSLYILKPRKEKILNKKDNSIDLSFPLLYLDFNILSCILLINKDKTTKEFQIKILGTNKSFSFILKDEKDYNKYIYLIGGIIHDSEGYKQNKLGLSLRNNIFYKEIYITSTNFESKAKTGDLLLFKSIDICADLQRLYTCDTYDHVGIVYKDNNKIKIFESTSIGKCSPLNWNYFKILLFNLVYHKIAYRQLIYENDNKDRVLENQSILEEKCKNFFNEIEGKNYYLSLSKILCCQKPDDYEYNKKFENSQGFCCSALAAALYVKIGVARLEKSVHSIKPGDFEQNKNKIFFEKGYHLGPEQVLDFSE